jgi:hypothetical protein
MRPRLKPLLPALFSLLIAGTAQAGGSTALGGAIGGGAGAVIGEAIGGREGAIIGGAVGGGVGAAVGYDNEERRIREPVRHEERHYYEDRRHAPNRGHFCPPGQAKKGHC